MSDEEEIIEDILDILEDSKSESISDDLPLYYSNTENPLSKNFEDDKMFLVDPDFGDLAKHFKEPEASGSGTREKKEISPLSDDVILINDKKVNIKALESLKPKNELSMEKDSIENLEELDEEENDFSIDELEICSASMEKQDQQEEAKKPLNTLYEQTKAGLDDFHIEQKEKQRSIEALNLHSVDINNWFHFKTFYKKNPGKDLMSLTSASTEYRTFHNEDSRLFNPDLGRLHSIEEENKRLKSLNSELTKQLESQMESRKLTTVKKDSIEQVIHDFTEMLTPDEKEIYSTTLLKLKNYFDSRVGSTDDHVTTDERIAEIEARHCKEMEDLRKYFEKRCIDIEKQYSDEVFSMRSSRKSDILPSSDEDDQNEDILGSGDSKITDSKPEEVKDPQEKINWARELVLRELESQIQNLLFENNTEQFEWPQELIILRDQFTSRCQLEVANMQKVHEEELDKIKADSELELKKLIEERENLKEISTSLRSTLEEVMKLISVNNLTTDDSLNISLSKEQKINLFLENSSDHEMSLKETEKTDFNVSISKVDVEECLYRLKIEAANILDLSKRYFKQSDAENLFAQDPIFQEDIFDHFIRKSKSYPSLFIERFYKNEKFVDQKTFEEKSTSTEMVNEEMARSFNFNFEIPKETFVEGFGLNKCSPVHMKKKSLLIDLKSKTKNLLSSLYHENVENSMDHQFLQKFNEEIDAILEFEKLEKEDLQLQIDAADKQLKSTRTFLEQQTAERELERDEFNKEIEYLKSILKEKEKDKLIHQKLIKENEFLQQNNKELAKKTEEVEEQSQQLEKDLKASVEKICVLREIIADLEAQVAEKDALADTVLNTPDVTESERSFAPSLSEKNVEVDGDLLKKVSHLEHHIETLNAEHLEMVTKINSQLQSLEFAIERKIRTLETFNAVCSTTCNSPSEDISARAGNRMETETDEDPSYSYIEELQRIFDKLSKHSRIEEVTIKRISDLEMQVASNKMVTNEMQQERETLQERSKEQEMKIASLQSRLDEARMRADKINNSELIIKVQDLQNEIKLLNEKLESKEKQIASLSAMLESSRKLINDQDEQLAINAENEKLLRQELNENQEEFSKLEAKIKAEMIDKTTIPDLMETLIAEKNIEISNLEDKLVERNRELEHFRNLFGQNKSHEANLFLGKSYDEPDVLRDVAEESHREPSFSLGLQGTKTHNINTQTYSFLNPLEISNVHLEQSENSMVSRNSGSSRGSRNSDTSREPRNDEILIVRSKEEQYEKLMEEKALLEMEIQELKKLRSNPAEEISKIKATAKELEQQLECKDKDINNLKSIIDTKEHSLTSELSRNKELQEAQNEMVGEIETLKHQMMELMEIINEKNQHIEDLSAQNKHNKIESNELDNLKRELSLKSFALEKCKYDLQDYENQIIQLKERFMRGEQKTVVDPINVDEITEKLEKELNYSAELDSNLIKAFEQEAEDKKVGKLERNFKEKYEELLQELDSERKYFKYIHMHDVSMLESVKLRLNTAMDNENVLKKLLDTEEQKNDDLVAQLNKVNLDLLNSDPNSMKYLESEVISRLNNEIDYLKSRNSSEQKRILELQRIIENESQRFSRAFAELNDYCDSLKKLIKKVKHEKDALEMQVYRTNQNMRSAADKYQLQEFSDVENKRNFVIMHELEDRLHHLLIKYLRSESYRKGLIYQKRYLMVAAAKITCKVDRKKSKFKTAVLAVIAIARMKYIAKRWNSKKMSGKLICLSPSTPKRSQSTSTNKWATNPHDYHRC